MVNFFQNILTTGEQCSIRCVPPEATVKPEADQKKKPGGQPGHEGKTRKGFGRVDRTEISSPSICLNCGSQELSRSG